MSNGNAQGIRATTVKALDKLELQVKALTLHEHDIILVQFESQPSVDEFLDFQRNVAHMMSHLKLDFPVFWMIVPPGVTLMQLDKAELAKMGYTRKEGDDEQRA